MEIHGSFVPLITDVKLLADPGYLRLDGNFMVGCLRFPQCRNVVWLPGAVAAATVSSDVCNSCNPGPIYKIQLKFRRLEIPPNYDVNHLGRGQRSAEPSSNSQRRNTRPTCVRCRQMGHSSDDCPFQGPNVHVVRPARPVDSQNGGNQIQCTCGEPCVMRTANTATNRGRKFYSCQSRECDFFVWEDNVQSNGVHGRGASRGSGSRSSSNAGRRGGRSRGQRVSRAAEVAFVTATGEPVNGRCFVCGDPSHFANACPNRGHH
ncbi:hypothetical protein QJS10_CPB15g01975 [Acorus calamus]|uniref:DNA topoisomerase n=1 Tax=Acorus calamus TaxID=4465 RepID=A0AAV9DBI6_ACOCL|nr:hypothetical protein QJS10_CPB15g01975 [Acorus calamus]